MKSSEEKIVASLRFDLGDEPAFWSLAPLVCDCLRRADIAILEQTVGFGGESMEFETDHGRIELAARGATRGRPIVEISTDIDRICPRQTARQICFLLSSHLAARHRDCAIHWAPTRQTLAPEKFTWGALDDVPHPLAYADAGRPGAGTARPN